LSNDQDEFLWELSQDLCKFVAMREPSLSEVLFWKATLQGTPYAGRDKQWNNLRAELNPRVVASLAYVLGCHYVHNLNDPAGARAFFEIAKANSKDRPQLGGWVDRELTGVGKN